MVSVEMTAVPQVVLTSSRLTALFWWQSSGSKGESWNSPVSWDQNPERAYHLFGCIFFLTKASHRVSPDSRGRETESISWWEKAANLHYYMSGYRKEYRFEATFAINAKHTKCFTQCLSQSKCSINISYYRYYDSVPKFWSMRPGVSRYMKEH